MSTHASSSTTSPHAAATGSSDDGNRLLTAPIRPIAMPLWYGCEIPGADAGAIALRDGLARRWESPRTADLRERLRPAITIPVAKVDDAEARSKQRSMAFLPEIDAANALLADAVETAVREGELPVILGGDHALAIGSMAGLARTAATIGVVWIDTHPDLNTPATSGSGHIHGMPLAAAIGDAVDSMPQASALAGRVPMVRPEHLCLLGIRDIDPYEHASILKHGIYARTMDEWSDDGIVPGLDAALSFLLEQGVDAVHVSFDLDVLDPVFLPGTGTRYPGGLSVREASQVLRRLGAWKGPIRSLDLVELNPLLDPSGHSTHTALHLLATALGQRMLSRE